MALPNGDLITTVFDPQMAYPVDKRMQVDTLNSRDSMSMFIRWEGMEVYVLENKTKYILQGGRSNEYWKETGTGTGTGGTTFVGQFPTADLLPTSGRSAGDYAFVGTGDDFVQYNWDNIANQWVMAEGQTDMASEFFHVGYKTPLRRPVIFPLLPKDVLVQESGDFVFTPETDVARFIFVGEVTAIRGIETAAADREIKLVNRTGSDIILRDKASGTPTGSGFDFGGTDYTWVNGSEITLKGNGTYWELAPNNQIAFSDHLDSVNAKVSVGPDGLEVITNLVDKYTRDTISVKQTFEVPTIVDGIINIQKGSKYYKRVLKEYNLGEFNVLPENTAAENATNFAFAQAVIPHDSKIILPSGRYNLDDVTITKSGVYDFSGVTIVNSQEIAGGAISIESSADFVNIVGVNVVYEGIFYTTSVGYTPTTKGVAKHGISAKNKKTILTNCRASGFSHTGFDAQSVSGAFYLIACTAKNNGYSGAFGRGKDFQIFGGEYSENGGTNNSGGGYGDGYGIVGNIGSRGNFKVIGVTANWNRTRNIDSHTGNEIIISGNYTDNAGQEHPQWFNQSFDGGHGIRMTQLIQKCIISNNISRRNTLSGIAVDSQLTAGQYIRDCIVDGNSLEDNRYQISIKQNQTEKLIITNNICTVTGDVSLDPDQADLMISPDSPDTLQNGWIKEFVLSGNLFDSRVVFTASGNTEKHNIKVTNNSFRSFSLLLGSVEANMLFSGNCHETLQVVGTNPNNIIIYKDNIQDKKESTSGFNIHTGFTGFIEYTDNYLLNSNATTLTILKENMIFSRNKMIGCSKTVAATFGIRTSSSNTFVEDNYISCVMPPTYAIHVQLADKMVVKGNVTDNGNQRFAYVKVSNGLLTGINSDKIVVDTFRGIYDVGINTGLEDVSFTFKDGDKSIVRSPIKGGNAEFIYNTGIWIPFNFSQKPDSAIASGPSYNPPTTDNFKYLRFTGNAGDINILENRFLAENELIGEIEGGAKTFVAGAGVTLRYPDGQGLVAPTGSRFIVRFKSANDALVTIIKPYTSTEILSATATLDFPTIAAGETERLTATVTGAALLDPVVVSGPDNIYNSNNSTIDAWVSAANTVTVRVRNNGASSIDPGEGQFKIKVFK